MSDVVRLERPVPALGLGEDRRWVIVMAIMTTLEFCWWLIAWSAGIAPAPLLPTYLALAFAALAGALALRFALRRSAESAPWRNILVATVLTGIGASLFLPLKFAIPSEIPFWLDAPLAVAERRLFGADPWIILDGLLGWAAIPIDRIYGMWLPVQSLVLFTVMLEPASPTKSRALIAYSLAWFVLGVAAAALLSSAGPLFYDRFFGGQDFALLGDILRARGASVALAESNAMWASLASGQPTLVAGISAMPSLHVAISVWMVLTARAMASRALPVAIAYASVIWIASVQLGWHYVAGGTVAAVGMIAIWKVAGIIERVLSRPHPHSRQG